MFIIIIIIIILPQKTADASLRYFILRGAAAVTQARVQYKFAKSLS